MKNILLKFFVFIAFSIVISIPMILPYLNKGYFPTHDGEWAVVRMGDMFRSVRDYQIPVRYSGNLNFGYGYPLFNFAYPGPYYVGTAFHLLNIGFVDSVKLLFVFSVIFSALGMFFLSRELWRNNIAAAISAIFYVYLPYRIVDLYARGSIGESLSFVCFPFILFFLSRLLNNISSKFYLSFSIVTYAILIITHNIMAVLFTPVLIIFIAIKLLSQKEKPFLKTILFFILSYGLSAFFWLPALLEKSNILLSKTPIADRSIYFVTIKDLIFPKWGYGLPNNPDGFSYQIGLSHIAVVLTAIGIVIFILWKKRELLKKLSTKFAFAFSVTTIALILLMFSFTAPLWKIMPLLKEINYPWTLLAVIGFIISLLSGFLWLQNKFIKYLIVILSLITVVSVTPFAKPESYFDKGDGYYLTNEATTTSSQELMPLWVKDFPTSKSEQKIEIISGNGQVSNIVFSSNKGSFALDLNTKSLVRVNTIYYPGWEVKSDGLPTSISYNNSKGVIEFIVASGKHNVELFFSETPIRLLANIITLLSLLILLILFFFKKNKK